MMETLSTAAASRVGFFPFKKRQNGFFNLQPQMQDVSLHSCAPASSPQHFHQEGQTDATQTQHIATFDLGKERKETIFFFRVLFTSTVFVSRADQEKKDSSSGEMEPVSLLRSN